MRLGEMLPNPRHHFCSSCQRSVIRRADARAMTALQVNRCYLKPRFPIGIWATETGHRVWDMGPTRSWRRYDL